MGADWKQAGRTSERQIPLNLREFISLIKAAQEFVNDRPARSLLYLKMGNKVEEK